MHVSSLGHAVFDATVGVQRAIVRSRGRIFIFVELIFCMREKKQFKSVAVDITQNCSLIDNAMKVWMT